MALLTALFSAGLLLSDGGSGQVREDSIEAAAAVHPDHHVARVAGRRGNGLPKHRRQFPVAVEGPPVHTRVPGHRDAQHAGRLHGQGAEVHGQGDRADRQDQDHGVSAARNPLLVSRPPLGAHRAVPPRDWRQGTFLCTYALNGGINIPEGSMGDVILII